MNEYDDDRVLLRHYVGALAAMIFLFLVTILLVV